ncbi:zeaxanthin epoxidase, chloroplastic isoform X2 [Rhododendron vialii]|uniref:zeaxanthin epoxidase, chloroplastic isoform X2 n=1 Tax=Rhododendron vialii TaxID=182163 RepID=UPI00265E0EA2|nr:zeaxanthin epoxidase, chloroplastic isoform X2 [Rhododendron vialii]
MASTLFCSSINPSTTNFSRTRYAIPISKHNPVEFFHSLSCNKENGHMKTMATKAKLTVSEAPPDSPSTKIDGADKEGSLTRKKLRILVAGGGIGGLVLALAAKRRGFEVLVFERDMSAIRGEGQYRGPIQVQSNALAALEAIDMDVADEVMKAGCITGDRINGLVDGISGNWYVKFDTFTPAAERGLPVTRVISRMTLQQILAQAVGEDIIMNDSNVVNFEDHGDKVTVTLENGQQYDGDLLVGADGIWSKVRKNLFGPKEATYSGYTCYTGIADFVPADIGSVGYRVFLGHKQYFVSSDVGGGKMQWYAFHNEAPGGVDAPNGKRERLLKIFEGWCDNVIDLLLATDEDAILRRDIYDRSPIFTWGRGRVTLLGDSVHAMQPNLGQGGCMAIEDSYQLALELDKAWERSIESGSPIDVVSSLKRSKLEGRSLSCRLSDRANDQLRRWFEDDDALERAVNGEWCLLPYGNNNGALKPIFLSGDEKQPCIIGGVCNTKIPGISIAIPSPQVSEMHARISCKDGAFFVTDLRSEHGTWISDNEGKKYRVPPNFPARFHPSDIIEFGSDRKVAFRVKVMKDPHKIAEKELSGVLQPVS